MMKSPQVEEYEGRVNRVLDYIDGHLGEPLVLDDLARVARVAAFSPFHMHRIFSAVVGEPVGAYVRRVRLERAASRLEADPRLTITEAAIDFGFTSSSTFARAFKVHFGISASEWRKDRKTSSKAWQAAEAARQQAVLHPARSATGQDWIHTMNIETKILPTRRVAYVRALGPYEQSADKAWAELCAWAGPRGLLGPSAVMLGVSHDDPSLTEASRLRYDACVEVGPEVQTERNIGIVELVGGEHAVAFFKGKSEDIKNAYAEIYGRWMPETGHQPGDSACYEHYLGDPADGVFVMNICVPVKPL